MHPSLRFALALAACLFLGGACNKPDMQDCRRACWNHNKVMFWDKVDQDVKGLSPEESATIRAQREIEYRKIEQREEDPGLMNCMTNCQQNASKEQVACMIEAKTAAQQQSCEK